MSHQLAAAHQAAQDLRDAETRVRAAEAARRRIVREARAAGATWAAIGDAIGTGRSRAHTIAHSDDRLTPTR